MMMQNLPNISYQGKFELVILMKNIKRIAIIGNAGSGKSTLALKLHSITKLPVYHLDQYFFMPNWEKPIPEEYKIVHDSLCDKEEWIIEGVNLKLLDYRAARADIIIFLDVPRYICLWRTFKRTIVYYGKERPESADGCKEQFNKAYLKLIKYIWNFEKEYHPIINEILTKYSREKPIYILKSRKEIDHFCKLFDTQNLCGFKIKL